jgi:DNA-binding MarR family transcriptional regulator
VQEYPGRRASRLTSGAKRQLVDKFLCYQAPVSSSTDNFRAFAWELRRVFHELASASDRSLAPLGITVGDRAVLEFLSRETAPISLSQLARKHSVSRQHIQQALRRLPDESWIQVSVDPNDARTLKVQLSPAGMSFWSKVQAFEEDCFGKLTESIDADELRCANEFLARLRKKIADLRSL